MAFADGYTIGRVIESEAVLQWRCRDCRRQGLCDAQAIARRCGWNFSLVDQHPPCRTPGCLGRIVFTVGFGMRWMSQESPEATRRAVAAAAYPEASTLHAHGWRIAGGLWRPPQAPMRRADQTH